MKIITKNKANDGSEWMTVDEAIVRDILIFDVADVMSVLESRPTELNWEGYVRQTQTAVNQCKKGLFALVNQEGVLASWINSQQKDHQVSADDLIYSTHPSWFCRMLEYVGPLTGAYSRLCCIDDNNCECNHPFFSNNP